jgi:ubiquinol-cytochrome c reductase cytochrome c subunit
MNKLIYKALLALLLPVLACAQSGGPNVENGKRLYIKDGCYECHGYAGQGGAGARLAPKVLPIAALIAYVRHPAGAMPPYTSKVASDADLADIRAFLASLPAPPPLSSIPLLNQ